MNYRELEYSEQLWNLLFPLSEHQGDSLHCTEWTCIHEAKSYRLIECTGELRIIEESVNG